MRRHRWIIVSALAVALVVPAAACSSTKDQSPSSAPASPGTTGGTVPVTTPAVKTPGTTATTENGTALATTSTKAPGSTKPAVPDQVAISDFLFAPATLEVKAGTSVTWVNDDEFDHWVLADDKTSFDSAKMAQGATYAHTFATPGTFSYFCNIHNQMKGTIVVS